jgi:hypothetical protein
VREPAIKQLSYTARVRDDSLGARAGNQFSEGVLSSSLGAVEVPADLLHLPFGVSPKIDPELPAFRAKLSEGARHVISTSGCTDVALMLHY